MGTGRRDDDDDPLETTMTSAGGPALDPSREIAEVLTDLETLFKNGDVGAALAARNVNTSLALLIVSGLRAYVSGHKAEAAEDLATAAEEISARAAARSGGGAKPS